MGSHRAIRAQNAPARHAAIRVMLHRRARRWCEESDTLAVVVAFEVAAIRLATIKTFLYAWCTSKRFRQPWRACLVGCNGAGDEQSHYLSCPAGGLVREVALMHDVGANRTYLLLMAAGMSDEIGLRAALVLDLLLVAFDRRRLSGTANARLLIAGRLKELRRWHVALRDLQLVGPMLA